MAYKRMVYASIHIMYNACNNKTATMERIINGALDVVDDDLFVVELLSPLLCNNGAFSAAAAVSVEDDDDMIFIQSMSLLTKQ